MNETSPVAGSTVKVPLPGTTNVVFVQSFGVSTGSIPQSFTLVGSSGMGETPAVSLPKGFNVCTTFMALLDESGFAVGIGGAPTVTVIVEFTNCPESFAAWYLIGVAVPLKVGSGSKVTNPVAGSTTYEP